ncbi:DUF4902 domain-containing protein [Chitinimonas naiadis]
MLTLAPDGLVRTDFSHLRALPFRPHLSWTDDLLREELCMQGLPAILAGHDEWASDTGPLSISIGWTWLQTDEGSPIELAPGGFSTNLMLRDVYGYDLGQQQTEALLQTWLHRIDWQFDIKYRINRAFSVSKPSQVQLSDRSAMSR